MPPTGPDRSQSKKMSHSGRECEWKEEREIKESGDARTEGFKTGQQQKTHCPLVYTQPHPSSRPGPAHSSSPHPHHPSTSTPNPSCHFSPFHPSSKQLAHIIVSSGRNTSEKGTCSWWMKSVNGQLGEDLQTWCAASHHDECSVRDYTLTVMRLSSEGMLINAWHDGVSEGVCDGESWPSAVALYVVTAHM